MDPVELLAGSCDNLAAMPLMTCRHVPDTPSYLASDNVCAYSDYPSKNAPVSSTDSIKPLPASCSASKVVSRKRKRTGEYCHANDTIDAILLPRPDKQLELATVSDARLACPFFKKDFIQHNDCMHAAYQTWAHVKQHLKRKHFSGTVGCGRPSPDMRDVNYDANGNDWCISEEKHLLSKIGDAQMRLIDEKTKARMPDNVRWNVAWGIIFPQLIPPKTPYSQDIIDEFEDHAIRRIPNPGQSSPAELVASPLGPRAVVSQFFQLLRVAHHLSTTYDRAEDQHQGSKEVPASLSTKFGTGLINCCSHERISHDNLEATGLDANAPTCAGIADQDGFSIYEEPPTFQHCFYGQNL